MKLVTTLIAAAFATAAYAGNTTGAGATFPAPVYFKWAEQYANTGTKANYTAIGSSGGIKQIDARTVDFGATDDPRKAADVAVKAQYQFPTVMGGVVIVLNVDGIAAGQLKLDGTTAAAIFDGTIRNWNDQRISKLNPGIQLPNRKINVAVRADGSGTTAVFTDYLAKQSENFKNTVGKGKRVKWPDNSVGGKGNAGVAATVQQLKDTIGYVEYAFAKSNNIPHVAMINKSGKLVQPSAEAFKAAAAGADWNTPAMAVNLNDQLGDGSWPITSATFILVYDDRSDRSKNAVKFFDWAFAEGDKAAEELDYVPLPDSVKEKIRSDWKRLGLK